VEAAPQGPAVRPVYVGRIDLFNDPRSNALVLSVSALQQTVPRGAAVFALDGSFIGLASDSAGTVTVIPADTLKALAEGAHPAPQRRADLGVDVQTLTSALATAAGADRGVMVTYVHPRGPASGTLLSGDVIQTVDGTGITTVTGFQQVASSRTPGATVALGVVRRGKPLPIQIKAADAERIAAAASPQLDPGMALRGVDGIGVEVVALEPGGAAARAGLQPGDVVIALDGRSAPGAAQLVRAYRESPAHDALLLTIRRGTAHRVVALAKQ
jgi:serine protease Do